MCQSETKTRLVSKNLSKGKASLTPVLKRARIATRSTKRKKTLTGVANFIRVIGVVKCGGAAVRQAKRLSVANIRNTSPRTMPRIAQTMTAKRRKKLIAT